MTTETETTHDTETAADEGVAKWFDVLKEQVTAIGAKVSSLADDRRADRERTRLLRRLGETTLTHCAAGGSDFSPEMLELIDELAYLDEGAEPRSEGS